MKQFAAVVLALFACQGCLARPKVESNQVEELVQNAQNLAKKIGDQLGVKDLNANEIESTIKDNAQKLTDTIKGFLEKMDAERKAHEGDINTGIKGVQDTLQSTVVSLQKAAGPEATKKADEMKVEFDKAYKTTVEQMDLFYKQHQPELKNAQENINKFSQSLLNSMLEIGDSVQKSVKTAIEEHEKTHKH